MSNKKKDSNFNFGRNLRAKLSFDEGFAERPIYVIKANTGEKEKGIGMVELIENNFNISEKDKELFKEKMIMMQRETFKSTIIPKKAGIKQVEWTKDDKGNIVSPFKSKKWRGL